MNGDGGVVDGGHQGRESRAAGMMPIFVPPTVFGEMEGADRKDRKDRKRGQVQSRSARYLLAANYFPLGLAS